MIKQNITYYFGAGASANAIPAVDGMRDGLQIVRQRLADCLRVNNDEVYFNTFPEGIIKFQKHLEHIISDIDWLLAESEYHQTVDTLAKKFFLSDIRSLNRLKRVLIVYFTLIQTLPIELNKDKILHKRLDKRYDNLIASIANGRKNQMYFNPNVKFITWNYDMQIELAASRFAKFTNINAIKENLQILPNRNSIDSNESAILDLNKFATIKLNGNAFFDLSLRHATNRPSTFSITLGEKKIDDHDVVANLLEELNVLFPDWTLRVDSSMKYFHFAWESDPSYSDKQAGYNLMIDEATRILNQTEVLIIVGYSFPFFNYEIDFKVLNSSRPHTVIIQDYNAEELLKEIQVRFPQLIGTDTKVSLSKPSKYFPIHPYT